MTALHSRPLTDTSEPPLQIASQGGGLVIVGPTTDATFDIEGLCAAPNTEGIEASAVGLSTWKIASAEALQLARSASRVLRAGRTPVVYLDAHVDASIELAEDRHEFVCARLAQIMMGLADQPAYLALHGQRLARAIVADCLGVTDVRAIGTIAEVVELWQLAPRGMFPSMPVAVSPASQQAGVLRSTLDWLEDHRE